MKGKIEGILQDVFKSLGYDETIKIVSSKFDDFQCDVLFTMAKKYHDSPISIGKRVVEEVYKLDNFSHYFKSVEIKGAGFINICVSDEFINECLKDLIDDFGFKSRNKTVILDYGGPNVAKPLHVGHLRSAIIGQAINNILKFTGYKTISDVHLGDFGLQMGQVIYGILHDFENVDDASINLDYLNEVYPKISTLCKEDDDVKNECLLITKELQNGNEVYRKLWKKICDISVSDIKSTYDYLSVHFDLWLGESDSYKYYDELFKIFEDKKVVRTDDGAKIIEVAEDDDKITIPPCIVQKSDGAYLYATSDLGTIYQRKKDYDPDNIIYITDNRQELHFTQVFRACKKSQIYDVVLEHYGFGTVNGTDNKPFKTRTGGTMKLNDLIEEVKIEFVSLRVENKNMSSEDIDIIVNAIIKFADLQNDLTRNYIFDISKFCNVNGKTGPYILYTYLRISKLLSSNDGVLSNIIYNDIDRKLRLKLLDVHDVIEMASLERKPHYIANYLYELCVIGNSFYESNKMSGLDEFTKNDYDIVLSFNNHVIETLLGLLGIKIPKKM